MIQNRKCQGKRKYDELSQKINKKIGGFKIEVKGNNLIY